MLELSRTVRFCISQDGTLAADAAVSNSFAAWPPMQGLGRYYELHVTCRGKADAVTGYFMNIKRIDQAVRTAALPVIAAAAASSNGPAVGQLMRRVLAALQPALDRSVAAVRLQLTPTYSIAIAEPDMQQVLMTQQYEFAAAHRLHVEQLSERENVEIFGKCNNPAGHGHNYRVEVTVRSPIDANGAVLSVQKLDELVDRAAISQLDHKNLDVDVPQFEGLNTSVENIAKVVYEMLRDPMKKIGAELDQVKVWETSKTSCTYRG